MSRHALSVFDGAARVGSLGYESHEERFSFEYDVTWPQRPDAYPISPHLPMNEAQAASGTVRRFLENLLPEGRALDVVAMTHKVARNNLYGLIRELGKETAGALSFTAEGATPGEAVTTQREITREELATRITEREQLPFSVWDGKVRMSIAGYQDKLAVYRDEGGRMFLVEGQLASTHILKPEPSDSRLPLLVANEHYCMCLAARLGLRVAPVDILRLPAPVLVVERFDRRRSSVGVQRLHIIDACQALNVPVAYKYERNFGSGRDVRDIRDGVSFERLFSVSDYTTQKAVARRDLLRWAILQYVIGNADAHGKNVSFFCAPDGLALAPCYDLVSVVQYEGLDHDMAMAYGDEFALADIKPYDWAVFAQRIQTPRALLLREMRRMGKLVAEHADAQARTAHYVGEEQAFVGRIARSVQQRARTLVEAADLTADVELAGLDL